MEIQNPFTHSLTTGAIVRWAEGQINHRVPAWARRLVAQPDRLGETEEEILVFGRELAQRVTTVVLYSKEVQQSVAAQAEAIRCGAPGRPRKVYRRPRRVALLCGLVLTVMVTYCAPRRNRERGAPRGVGRRGKERVGLYPEWAALGIREGASPALQSEAGRMVALMPSMEAAREELARRGCHLNVKTVRRLSLELGTEALAARKDDLSAWRRGEVSAGTELAGKRVGVAIDGGRTRTRRTKRKGKRTKKGRHRFDTPWREPKVVVIYELDGSGAIDRSSLRTVDGTLLGPDHLMELVAYHLHRLGASEAKQVVFLGDGAEWIWDRVPQVAAAAGLAKGRWYQALDMSHAVSHIAKALEACKHWTAAARRKQLTRLRHMLRAGKVAEVIDYLTGLRQGRRSAAIQDEIEYLDKRRHLMKYAELRRKKLPIGSGAVESAIRRIVNLRIKGPGMFWDEANVEAVMYLRTQALTGRWEEMLSMVRAHARRTRDLTWTWEATPMSVKAAPELQLLSERKVKRRAA